MLNDIVLIILSLSVSGTIMALLLFAGNTLLKKHVTKAFSYYIWILVLLRLLIPFSFDQSITNQLFNNVSSIPHRVNEITIRNPMSRSTSEQTADSKETYVTVLENETQPSIKENLQVNTTVGNNDKISVKSIMTIIWIIGSCIALMYCIIPYIYLKQKIKDANTDPDSEDSAILRNLAGRRKIVLKYNSYINTPMLIGIMSPCIVIPGCDYVKNGKKQEIENILCHELMHYKRKDLIYKWFTVIVTSLHWFNPLMLPIRRQISRNGELSCDEAILRKMDAIQKQSYGETLLSMAADKRISAGILATTMCEEKKELKERLLGIKKYKKQTTGMIVLSVIIAVLLTGCGTWLGSVSKEEAAPIIAVRVENTENDTRDVKSTDQFKWYGETNLISEGTVFPDTIINSDEVMNDFLDSDRTIALLATIPNENIYLYGLKENGSGREDDFLYKLHGICIRQGEEIEVLDIDWGIYGDIPQIQYEDYDKDGQKELAMILRSEQGTDLSLLDLHIFEKSDHGGWVDNYFTDWADRLYKMVMFDVDNGILKLFVKGKQIEEVDISDFEGEWGKKFEAIVFGNNVKFSFDDGKIYLQSLPMAAVRGWVTPQEITDTYIKMEVKYYGVFILKGVPIKT